MSDVMRRVYTSILLVGLCASPARAGNPNLEYKDCGATAKTKIAAAVQWLIDNLGKIDQKMGKNGLMNWPGDSRDKFKKKLEKELTVFCIDEKKRCDDARKTTLRGRAVPILHQQRVELCTNHLEDDADYASVIAHEIGHLIRLNAHPQKCEKYYEDPSFSSALGYAVYHAYNGTNYNAGDYTKYCPK